MSDPVSAGSRSARSGRRAYLRPAATRPRKTASLLALLLVGGLALAQPQSAPAPQGGQRITPNFKDADITQIIEAVSVATNKNFIIDPRVRAQVTMLSSTSMTPDQFYQAFLAILQVHGFVAVPAGNVIKIVPDANMRQYPGNDLPDHVSSTSDEIVTQVLAVKNVSAAQLVPVLRPLQATNGQMSAVTGSNMLVLSDRASNINRLMRIIERIDQTGSSDIDVLSLQSATAADTVRVLNALVAQTADAGQAVKIVADDRSNSILISGDATQRLRLRTLVAHLDTPIDTGSETQVRYLRYAVADDLATKLKEQLSGTGSSSSSSSANRALPVQAIPNAQGTTPRPEAQPANTTPSGPATISLAGGTATIWADKDTNALVITAAQRTMRAVNAVIDKLDIRRLQVSVQALIVEVDADKTADLGVNWAVDGSATSVGVGGFVSPIGGTSIVDLYTASQSPTTLSSSTLQGSTIGVGKLTASGINFAAVLRALQSVSRTNVIATPSIVTRDNQEAKVAVAQEIPILTGQYTTTTGTSSAFQTVQREEVGTILTVTPQISEGDAVLLKIQVESSSVAATSVSTVDVTTNKRTISTNVLIKDGGTLVLGGLIQNSSTNSESRVPLLGSIPLLGELFRARNTGKSKTNLLIFLQPHILRNDAQAAMETDAKYNYMQDELKKQNRETTVIPAQPFQPAPEMPPNNNATAVPGSQSKDTATPAAATPPAPATAAPSNAPAGSGDKP
ncbi:MAG: type II secretion system secretin GspD [Steroidobacterales bacterium]